MSKVFVRKYKSNKTGNTCYFLVVNSYGEEVRVLIRSTDVCTLLNLRPQELFVLDYGDYILPDSESSAK